MPACPRRPWSRPARDAPLPRRYRGTLSSYCYVLMCIFLLQTRPTPVLPRLQQLPPTFRRTIGAWTCEFCDDVRAGGRGLQTAAHASGPCAPSSPGRATRLTPTLPCPSNLQVEALRGFGQPNGEGLAELVWAFFEYWAWRHNYAHDVVSIRLGACLHKDDKDWTRRIGNERHLVRAHGRGDAAGRAGGAVPSVCARGRAAQPLAGALACTSLSPAAAPPAAGVH